MKFEKFVYLGPVLAGLLLAACGQSGPLYLKASAPKSTSQSQPPHPNQTTTPPLRTTPGVTSTQVQPSSQQPIVTSQQPVV